MPHQTELSRTSKASEFIKDPEAPIQAGAGLPGFSSCMRMKDVQHEVALALRLWIWFSDSHKTWAYLKAQEVLWPLEMHH